MKKLVFEVERVILRAINAEVLLRLVGDGLEVIEIQVPRSDDVLVQQWISRVGKKIQLVPEDM